MKLVWDESSWADYVWWQAQDRKVLKRINQLITGSSAGIGNAIARVLSAAGAAVCRSCVWRSALHVPGAEAGGQRPCPHHDEAAGEVVQRPVANGEQREQQQQAGGCEGVCGSEGARGSEGTCGAEGARGVAEGCGGSRSCGGRG